ncbi:crotonase/enoyl-CoA hydratase family protein [bacterium]|nr:crotonase/enoyl-CoA hydratase family protein [bacterium]
MSDFVKVEINDHVASVSLNRPDKYNSLSLEMFKAIIEAGEAIIKNKSIRAVVLSGEGKGFCAGLDFASFAEMGSGKSLDDIELFRREEGNPANRAQYVGYIWKRVPVPVIAAIHGVAYGGGLQIALAADIRLAKPDAKFSVMEIKWGLIPDMSGSQTLRDLIGLDVAKELTYTGRVIDAVEADRIGLITRVSQDPVAEANQLAREIASKNPDAIVAGKKLFESTWHGESQKGLELEETLQKTLIGSTNQLESVMANFENRPPDFQDRR